MEVHNLAFLLQLLQAHIKRIISVEKRYVINFSHCGALIRRDGQRVVLSFVFRFLQANLAIGLNHSAPVTVEQCVRERESVLKAVWVYSFWHH